MRSSSIRTIGLLIPMLALAAAAAGQASGEFTTSKRKPIRPTYAVAYDERDQRDARKHVVAVVLAEAPVDIAAAMADLDPHTHLINQKSLMDHNYVLLWIRPGAEVSMNATYREKMTQFIDNTTGALKADLKENTPDKIAGRIYTEKPIKTMDGETYSVNITFSTAVTRLPPGAKLAAGGGEPGKAFNALFAAIKAKNFKGILASVSEEHVKSFNDPDRTAKENLDDAILTLGFWLPKISAKITGGELRPDGAILDVEGEIFEGQKLLFLVRMIKSGPKWVFDRAAKAGFID